MFPLPVSFFRISFLLGAGGGWVGGGWVAVTIFTASAVYIATPLCDLRDREAKNHNVISLHESKAKSFVLPKSKASLLREFP